MGILAPEIGVASRVDPVRYREAVRSLAAAGSPFVFQNDSPQHASIVLETIIEFAKREIVIFDDQLDGDLSDLSSTFIDTVRTAVNPPNNKIVRIVVERRLPSGEASNIEQTLRTLCSVYPESVSVRIASETFMADVIRIREELGILQKIHFAVGDGMSYRLEFPTKARKAYCSFNAPETAERLRDIFTRNFLNCENYFTHAEAVT